MLGIYQEMAAELRLPIRVRGFLSGELETGTVIAFSALRARPP